LPFEERWTAEVYYDILRSIHRIGKAGKRITVSRIGYEAFVPNRRLKDRLGELRELGLVDTNLSVTQAGYDFCGDYTNYVDQFLRKYRLHPRD